MQGGALNGPAETWVWRDNMTLKVGGSVVTWNENGRQRSADRIVFM